MCQTVKPYEVIVVDDASQENMADVKTLCLRNNFRYIENETNIGLMKNCNNSIQKATGEYVTMLHNDDILSRFYVEEIQRAIEKHPNFNIYTTNGAGIDEKDRIIGEYRLFKKDTKIEELLGMKRLCASNYFSFFSLQGATVYRTKFIKENLFNADLENEADLENSLRFLQKQDIMYIDRPIYFTRIHNDQVSYKNKATQEKLERYISNKINIYRKYREAFKHVPDFMSKVKTLHLLQLTLKHKMNIKEVNRLLSIKSVREFVAVCFLIPGQIMGELLKKLAFVCHRAHINKYLNGTL